MSFNYKSGLAIARVNGGIDDGKIIYVGTGRPYDQEEVKKTLADVTEYLKKNSIVLSESDMKELCLHVSMKTDRGITSPLLSKLYSGVIAARSNRDLGPMVEIIDNQSKLSMLPRIIEGQTDILYLAAPQGSGKSRFTNNYMLEYKKLFPENQIYFFTSKDVEDKEITAPILRAIIDDSLITNPFNIADMPNSLFVFDDVDEDAMANKKHAKAIHTLILDIIKNGRKLGIRAVICRHVGLEGPKTKALFVEATHMVLFPFSSGSFAQNSRILEKYLGYGKKAIKQILSMPTRWAVVSRQEPQYIITENLIIMKSEIDK
jgi:hypothetical protein